MKYEWLLNYKYTISEVNGWFGDVDCPLAVRRSDDGTNLEVWDSSGWMEWKGRGEDFKPVIAQRLYLSEAYSEETWCRELVYSSGCMMASFHGLITDLREGRPYDPDRFLSEFWYVLCAFTTPAAAWEMVYGSKPNTPTDQLPEARHEQSGPLGSKEGKI